MICFDLDGTLAQHKTQLTAANRAVLDTLAKRYEIIMAGAGNCERIYKQMGEYPITILGNYGMAESRIVDGKFQIVGEDKAQVDKKFFEKSCNYLRKKYGYTDFSGESLEYHESGMVTFGLLGTKAGKEAKLTFDPDKIKRRAMFPEVKEIFKDYSVFIGGTTSFDITLSSTTSWMLCCVMPPSMATRLTRSCLSGTISRTVATTARSVSAEWIISGLMIIRDCQRSWNFCSKPIKSKKIIEFKD